MPGDHLDNVQTSDRHLDGCLDAHWVSKLVSGIQWTSWSVSRGLMSIHKLCRHLTIIHVGVQTSDEHSYRYPDVQQASRQWVSWLVSGYPQSILTGFLMSFEHLDRCPDIWWTSRCSLHTTQTSRWCPDVHWVFGWVSRCLMSLVMSHDHVNTVWISGRHLNVVWTWLSSFQWISWGVSRYLMSVQMHVWMSKMCLAFISCQIVGTVALMHNHTYLCPCMHEHKYVHTHVYLPAYIHM